MKRLAAKPAKLIRARHDGVEHRAVRLGYPGADPHVRRLNNGIPFGHIS
jgi:hypothetical protein